MNQTDEDDDDPTFVAAAGEPLLFKIWSYLLNH